MQVGRRGLLGLAAAGVAAALTTSCNREVAGSPARAVASPPPTPTPSAVGGSSFPGQPPIGHMYYGASLPRQVDVAAWEDQLGYTLGVHRSYFTPDHNETGQLVRQCRDDLAHGRLSHVSVKPTWTWGAIASGEHDDWLSKLLTKLDAEQVPLFLTIHHEPENDSGPQGMRPRDFVAMQTRVIGLAAETAPLVTVVPVLQHWTFDPLRPGPDQPQDWLVPDARAMGMDVYNPWSPTNDKEWRSFGSKVSEALEWFGATPLVIGEYGCRVDSQNPGRAAEWMRDAADFARENNFVSMSYFNSHVNSPDGTWALQGETEEVFAGLLASDWVTRP